MHPARIVIGSHCLILFSVCLCAHDYESRLSADSRTLLVMSAASQKASLALCLDSPAIDSKSSFRARTSVSSDSYSCSYFDLATILSLLAFIISTAMQRYFLRVKLNAYL